ncbi:MAG TPA: DNA-formamidopyrimidine glycosylase family protein [Acidimicrobiales bacterium]|nr:DNA-formamidopyrimidine glycosylase family protein [Acidimicrobiales bacterium]
MPELPQIQALAERLDTALRGRRLTAVKPLGFSGLKTVRPSPQELVGREVTGVDRRGKYVVVSLNEGLRLLFHLGNAGRVDVEEPAKATRPRGAVFRLEAEGDLGVLVREHGTERQAGLWLLADGDDGPLGRLGPDADEDDFRTLIRTSQENRRLHSLLRDQRFAAGIGRGFADDILNCAGLSPFAALRGLDAEARERLLGCIDGVLAAALAEERTRTGGLSAARLGEHFSVHNRTGQPCPRCGATLLRVSYDSYEITYCAHCQTHDRPLADRRLSRLLR